MPLLLVDGVSCAAFRPPIVRENRVYAAAVGCLARAVDRIRVDPDGVVELDRDGRRATLVPRAGVVLADGAPRALRGRPFWSRGALYVPLRASLEPLGASVARRTDVVSVRFPPRRGEVAPASPAPAWYPRAPRIVLFTPPPAPMPTVTPRPWPRRTPIVVRVPVPTS